MAKVLVYTSSPDPGLVPNTSELIARENQSPGIQTCFGLRGSSQGLVKIMLYTGETLTKFDTHVAKLCAVMAILDGNGGIRMSTHRTAVRFQDKA